MVKKKHNDFFSNLPEHVIKNSICVELRKNFKLKKPFLIRNAIDNPECLMTKDRFESLLSSEERSSCKWYAMKEFQKGELLSRVDRGIPNVSGINSSQARVLREMGLYLIVTNLELSMFQIANLIICLERAIDCYSLDYETNLFQSGASPGYGTLNQKHDIFALQLSGEKVWILAQEPVGNGETVFLTKQGCLVNDGPNKGTLIKVAQEQLPSIEYKLTAGDLLYVPAGTLHQQFTNSDYNLDFSIFRTAQNVDTFVQRLVELAGPYLPSYYFPLKATLGRSLNDIKSKLVEQLQGISSEFSELDNSFFEKILNAASYESRLLKRVDPNIKDQLNHLLNSFRL